MSSATSPRLSWTGEREDERAWHSSRAELSGRTSKGARLLAVHMTSKAAAPLELPRSR